MKPVSENMELLLVEAILDAGPYSPVHRATGASWVLRYAIRLYNTYGTNDLLQVWGMFWDYGNRSLAGALHLSQIATVHGAEKRTALSKTLNDQ